MMLRRFTHRTKKDEDRDEEIGPHLAHEQDARGLSPLEPRRQAHPRFGNPRATRERVWGYRSFLWLEEGWRDLRCAVRSLARTRGFTTVALLVITAGIGVNTAVFSVVDAVLLKPLTYPDPQALVQLVTTSNQGPIPVASIPEYDIWQQQSAIFQQVAAYDWGGAGMNLTGGDHPEQVLGIHVTSGYFVLFGAPVVAGRTFTAAEDSPNGGHFAVLSYGLWKRRFGGNPKIVGSTVQVDDQPWLVVGVIGREFVTDTPADLWIPFQLDLTSREMAHNFNVAARLKPDVTAAQANAQLTLAANQFRRTFGGNALPPTAGSEQCRCKSL